MDPKVNACEHCGLPILDAGIVAWTGLYPAEKHHYHRNCWYYGIKSDVKDEVLVEAMKQGKHSRIK